MATEFKVGDLVRFVSKFGDKVTGVYVGPSEIPNLIKGGVCKGHDVKARPFLPESDMEVLCFVAEGRLEKGGWH